MNVFLSFSCFCCCMLINDDDVWNSDCPDGMSKHSNRNVKKLPIEAIQSFEILESGNSDQDTAPQAIRAQVNSTQLTPETQVTQETQAIRELHPIPSHLQTL